MTEPENLVLDILRKMQAKQADHDRNFQEIKASMSRVEREIHAVRGDLLRQSEWMAGLEIRIDRIENRLELRDA